MRKTKYITSAILCAYFTWIATPAWAAGWSTYEKEKSESEINANRTQMVAVASIEAPVVIPEVVSPTDDALPADIEEPSAEVVAEIPEISVAAPQVKGIKAFTVSGELPAAGLNVLSPMNMNDPQGRFRLEEADGGASTRFYNFVDGYSIKLPGKVTVQNMNLSGLCAVLTIEGCHIEIFREDFSTHADALSYLAYSYRGLDNSSADTKDLKTTQNHNGRNIQIYMWHRENLSRMQDDFNYYTSLDIIDGTSVYNIYIKSQEPIANYGGYQSIIDSFTTMGRSSIGSNHIVQNGTEHHWNSETEAFYRQHFIEDNGLTWGIFDPNAPKDYAPLLVKEAELGFTFPVLLYYNHIRKNYEDYPVGEILAKAYAGGRVLELTLQTNSENEAVEGNMVYQVLNGGYDTFLHKYAAAVAAFGHPVMFRLGNEMNGDWCPYSAYHTSRDTAVYRAFYRYVYEIFRQEGALENTIWIWNPNERAFPNYKWNYETLYYPGDEYVDVIGLTGYNTGTYYASVGEVWRSFKEIYDPIYKKVLAYSSKPMMITEFSCSSIGGDKAAWVLQMFNTLKQYPRLKMAIWWDGRDLAANGEIARPYFINDNQQAVEYFKLGLKNQL